MIRDARRNVALAAGRASKAAAFRQSAEDLAKAFADQWLTKGRIVEVLTDIATAHDYFGTTVGEVEATIRGAIEAVNAAKNMVPPIDLPAKPAKRGLIAVRASELEPEKLVWVWPGRSRKASWCLLGGPPGLGKSQLTAFMSATVSNGGHWPCGEGSTLPGDVIFMSAEDGVQDTIIPRLMAAGADRERVHIVSAATKPDGTGTARHSA